MENSFWRVYLLGWFWVWENMHTYYPIPYTNTSCLTYHIIWMSRVAWSTNSVICLLLSKFVLWSAGGNQLWRLSLHYNWEMKGGWKIAALRFFYELPLTISTTTHTHTRSNSFFKITSQNTRKKAIIWEEWWFKWIFLFFTCRCLKVILSNGCRESNTVNAKPNKLFSSYTLLLIFVHTAGRQWSSFVGWQND